MEPWMEPLSPFEDVAGTEVSENGRGVRAGIVLRAGCTSLPVPGSVGLSCHVVSYLFPVVVSQSDIGVLSLLT